MKSSYGDCKPEVFSGKTRRYIERQKNSDEREVKNYAPFIKALNYDLINLFIKFLQNFCRRLFTFF